MRWWSRICTESVTFLEILSGRRSNGTRPILDQDSLDIRLRSLVSRLGRWALKRRNNVKQQREETVPLPSTALRPVRASTPRETLHSNIFSNWYGALGEYRRLLREYLFVKALEQRQTIMSEISEEKTRPDNPLSLKSKLWALFELDELEKAVEEFERRRSLWSRDTIEIAAMCQQLIGNISQARELRKTVRMFDFGEAIDSGQQIWIHGPQTQFEAQNLDFEPEVVVEFNPIESRPVGSSQKYVGYYSGSEVSTLQERIQGRIPTLDVAKVMSASDGRSLQRVGLKNPVWLIHQAEAVIPRVWGTAQGLQRALYDLMWSCPKRIMLTGVDFFTSVSKPWRSGYQRLDVPERDVISSLLAHDPFTNYLFVKVFFARGVVLSPVKVLVEEPRDYAEKLSSAIGKV